MSIRIRQEQPGDEATIHQVTAEAFLNAPHTDHTEQFIVDALRQSGALTISLVAEDTGKIVAHVAVSPVSISDGNEHWYGLGPISVQPDKQGLGIGSMLMQAAVAALKQIDAHGCVLLGDPGFYQRFGFAPKQGLVLQGVPAEYFQALRLQGEWPTGTVTYHDAFSA